MTKAKARARAKARLAAKATKPAGKGDKLGPRERKGFADAKSESMRNFAGGERLNTMTAMRRGAARSR